jgi:hypothetical protein
MRCRIESCDPQTPGIRPAGSTDTRQGIYFVLMCIHDCHDKKPAQYYFMEEGVFTHQDCSTLSVLGLV